MKDSLRGRAVFAAGGALFESDLVIYLTVDYNSSNARLTGRRRCLCDVGVGR
jgi:hypothetical protein